MPEPQPSSRSCFVCGRDNGGGLRVRWSSDAAAGEARAEVTLDETFNGYPGLAHGGIVAALLDEAMVRALLVDGGRFEDLMVTAKMEVSYRRATPTRVPITVVGRTTRRGRGRAMARAEIRLQDGSITAEAEGVLLRPPEDVARAWAEEKKHWRVD